MIYLKLLGQTPLKREAKASALGLSGVVLVENVKLAVPRRNPASSACVISELVMKRYDKDKIRLKAS